jgi:hypothetical protein
MDLEDSVCKILFFFVENSIIENVIFYSLRKKKKTVFLSFIE